MAEALVPLDPNLPVTADVFNALVAIVETLGAFVDNLDDRVELLAEYVGMPGDQLPLEEEAP